MNLLVVQRQGWCGSGVMPSEGAPTLACGGPRSGPEQVPKGRGARAASRRSVVALGGPPRARSASEGAPRSEADPRHGPGATSNV